MAKRVKRLVPDDQIEKVMTAAGFGKARPDQLIDHCFRFDYVHKGEENINDQPVAVFGKITGVMTYGEEDVELKFFISVPHGYGEKILGIYFSKKLDWRILVEDSQEEHEEIKGKFQRLS